MIALLRPILAACECGRTFDLRRRICALKFPPQPHGGMSCSQVQDRPPPCGSLFSGTFHALSLSLSLTCIPPRSPLPLLPSLAPSPSRLSCPRLASRPPPPRSARYKAHAHMSTKSPAFFPMLAFCCSSTRMSKIPCSLLQPDLFEPLLQASRADVSMKITLEPLPYGYSGWNPLPPPCLVISIPPLLPFSAPTTNRAPLSHPMTLTSSRFSRDADLEPKIGKQTLEIHHDKHHAKYVNVANQMIEGTDMEGDDCATIVMKAHKAGNQGLFNNAAQSWNHEFYWKCMKKVRLDSLFVPVSRDTCHCDLYQGIVLGHTDAQVCKCNARDGSKKQTGSQLSSCDQKSKFGASTIPEVFMVCSLFSHRVAAASPPALSWSRSRR